MKVSVVIPHLNACDFLEEAVDSVLAQTHQNFEILIADDGSDEINWQKIKVLAQKDERIRIFRQPQSGPAAARNTGIRHAAGGFIAFLDADDWWQKDKLENQLLVFEQNIDVGICFTSSVTVENGQEILLKQFPEGKLSGREFFNQMFHSALFNNSSAMIRKSVLENGLLDENRDLIGTEDHDFWLRNIADGVVFFGLNQNLTYYRNHAAGIHHRRFSSFIGKKVICEKYLRHPWLDAQTRLKQLRFVNRNLLIFAFDAGKKEMIPSIHRDLRSSDPGMATRLQGFLIRFFPLGMAVFLLRSLIYRVAYFWEK